MEYSVFDEMYKSIEKFKTNILPNNTKKIIKLNNNIKKYLDRNIFKYPNSLHTFMSGGNKDGFTKKLFNTYKKLDSTEIYNKLVITKNLLNSIMSDKKYNKKDIYTNKKGGYYPLSFYNGQPDIFYIENPYNVMKLSTQYPNFYIDDMSDFLSNKLYAIKMLSDNSITYMDGNQIDFFNHVNFMKKCNLELRNSNIYRYIDRNILQHNLSLLNCIINNHPEFYNKFKFTIDMLKTFCSELYDYIGLNVLDISLLTPQYLATGERWLLNLNYGLVTLNSFKVLMNDIIKN